MSQLESLLSISRLQSEQQLALLQQKRQSIAFMNQQLCELIDYSRSYQQSAVGTDGNLSSLLVHRQQFVSQLGAQIDELTNRISKLDDDAANCAAQWHSLDARQKAIESMYERKCLQDKYLEETIMQAHSDELARFSPANGFVSEQNVGSNYA